MLLQMGGPDKLDDIPLFLRNLFSDRDIIRLGPAFLQSTIARIIAGKRAPKSREIYRKIGGGSPLRRITEEQAHKLGSLLSNTCDCQVKVAMRYWQPRPEESLAGLDVDILIALPLYPHYSRATSGSSLKDLRKAHARLCPSIPLLEIPSWPEHPAYISALASKIEHAAATFGSEEFELVYSAHSLPVSFIEDGDPYVQETQKTISAVESLTGRRGRLCYQSRSGPVEWLSPSTSETLEELAANGCKNILMVPISFVSDHVETLYEINMLFKEKAAGLGMTLHASESLNDDPQFIEGLKELVLDRLQEG